MKGMIFIAFESFVVETHGREFYEELIESSSPGFEGSTYVGPATYDDERLMELVQLANERSGIPIPDLIRGFGRHCLPMLFEYYPGSIHQFETPRDLLLGIDQIIHVETKKLYPDAQTPSFTYEDMGDRRLRMNYQSPRKLCWLVEGLIDGLADYYGDTIEYAQEQCMHDGAEKCSFDVHFRGELRVDR